MTFVPRSSGFVQTGQGSVVDGRVVDTGLVDVAFSPVKVRNYSSADKSKLKDGMKLHTFRIVL